MTSLRVPMTRPAEAGFSLLELLVALAILGLVLAIAAPRVAGYLEGAKSRAAEIQLGQILTALDLYRLDNGDYPSGDQGLRALIDAPADAKRWTGPYLGREDGLNDPWGAPYEYARDGDRARVLSKGADRAEGGEGDDADLMRETM